jgi:fatty acid desaturase
MTADESFKSTGDIRSLINDLFKVRAHVYWLDFFCTIAVAWGGFWAALQVPWTAPFWKAAWLITCILAFFRGLLFVHEIFHRAGRISTAFRWAWNGLCGMPFFLPDYIYLAHAYHHRTASFSTKDDAEYVPVAWQRPLEILAPFAIFPFMPLLMAVRFLLLSPISLIAGGRLREWLLRHASTLKMNPWFEWKNISKEDRRTGARQDLLCFGGWAVFLVLFHRIGGWQILLQWYLVAYGLLAINHLRSLARHRYTNAGGDPVSSDAQLLDSVTIAGFSPLAVVLMPVGLRYHALHHMFPTLPYHALGQAHRRLVQSLPKDHLYFKTYETDFYSALRNFACTVVAHQASPRKV